MARLLLSAVLLCAAPALAQPVAPPHGPPRPDHGGGPGPSALASAEDLGRAPVRRTGLSPAQAVLLSVGATVGTVGAGPLVAHFAGDSVGGVVSAVGVFVGPSTGNVVLGNVRGALVGTGLRAGGAALLVVGVGTDFDSDPGANVAIVTGLGLFAGGVVYDLVSAGRYAGRVAVTPALHAGAPGAAVRVRL